MSKTRVSAIRTSAPVDAAIQILHMTIIQLLTTLEANKDVHCRDFVLMTIVVPGIPRQGPGQGNSATELR